MTSNSCLYVAGVKTREWKYIVFLSLSLSLSAGLWTPPHYASLHFRECVCVCVCVSSATATVSVLLERGEPGAETAETNEVLCNPETLP